MQAHMSGHDRFTEGPKVLVPEEPEIHGREI